MAKIEQMDYLVMNLGVSFGCSQCRVYSAISFGVQSFHVFNLNDDEVYTGENIASIEKWYWRENSWHCSSWGHIVGIFRDNGEEMYMKDERSVYLSDGCIDKYIGRVYQLAYYFDNSDDFNSTSLEDFLGTDNE